MEGGGCGYKRVAPCDETVVFLDCGGDHTNHTCDIFHRTKYKQANTHECM